MHLGLALPYGDHAVPRESPLRWETLLHWARRAEELGFDSVWLADHLFGDLERYGGSVDRYATYDPLVALGAIARATTSVRIGTLVLAAPLRPPTVLAKSLATLDVVSNGRLVAGVGAGWYEAEFVAAGVPFERPAVRLAQLAETIEILRGMWGGGPFTFDGEHYRAAAARCLPRPLQQPHPPIWVGGRGDRLLDVVARHADGWNLVWVATAEQYAERSRALDAACERAGRDPRTVTRSLGLYALTGEDERDLSRRYARLQELSPPGVVDGVPLDEWRRGRLVGTVEQVREQLAGWRDAGVDTLILTAGAFPFALASGDDVELLAEACLRDRAGAG